MVQKLEFFKTDYRGVFFIDGIRAASGESERIYYIRYKRGGKAIFEPVGRQYKDAMTPAKANRIRSLRMEGKQLNNKEQRHQRQIKLDAESNLWTIDRLWDEYTRLHTLKGIATDKNRYELHIKPTFGNVEPRQIAPLDVDRLRVRLSKKKAPATVKNTLELLRRIINFGVNKQLCPPISFKIRLPKVDNIQTETLTDEQVRGLIDACNVAEDKQATHLVLTALYTGMRRGELFRLQWDDVDFKQGFLTIKTPKSGITEKIPLNNLARNVLEAHKALEKPQKKKEEAGEKSHFVFPGRGGKQRVDIKKALASIRTAAKLPAGFRPLHGLRHVFASMLASSGKIDMYTLQKLLTHKSPAMTQRYAHLHDKSLKQAAEDTDSVFDEIKQVATAKKGNAQ